MNRDRGSTLGIAALAAGAALLAVLRIRLAVRLDPAPDEAWYWVWSRDLGLSYPDHPPAVAFLIRLGTSLLGDTTLGIRLGAIALGLLGVGLLFGLGRELGLPRPRAAAGALLGSLLPAPAAGSLLATPDALLGAVWIAAAWLLVRMAKTGESRRAHWLGLGLLLGVGLWSKHAALLLPAAAAAALALAGRLRRELARPGPWLGLGVAAVIVAPHLVAEISAGLPSVRLQAAHLAGALPGAGASGIGRIAEDLGGLLAGQLGLVGPVLAALLIWAAARRAFGRPELAAILACIAVPIAAATVAALFTHPEQNWAALGHPLAPAAALAALGRARESGGRSRERWLIAAFALPLLATAILVHVHAARPILPLPPQRDPVSRLRGWRGLSATVAGLEAARGAGAWICDGYGLAAELAFDRARSSRESGSFPSRGKAGMGAVLSTDRPWPGPGRFERASLLDLEGDWAGARPEVDCEAVGPPSVVELRREDGAVTGRVTVRPAEGCAIGIGGSGSDRSVGSVRSVPPAMPDL